MAQEKNGQKVAWNKYRLEMRRFLTKGVRFWKSLPIEIVETRNLTGFKTELGKFMNGVTGHLLKGGINNTALPS